MAIQWTGLFANVGYSSANNKTQDDAVTGMQDTLYVTGPGYGAYEAVVRLYNSTGALVASVNVSGGGGALSAPPPVRFVDNGTVYSYSLEVVRGYIPTEDADGIVIRLVGGASKRFPSPMSVTPSGDVQFGVAVISHPVARYGGDVLGDSITAQSPGCAVLSMYRRGVPLIKNRGVSGNTTAQMLARVPDVIADNPRECTLQGGTNDFLGGIAPATVFANLYEAWRLMTMAGIAVYVVKPPPTSRAGYIQAMADGNAYLQARFLEKGIRVYTPWDQFVDPATGGWISGASPDELHPSWPTRITAGITLAEQIGTTDAVTYPTPKINAGIVANPLMLTDTAGVATGITAVLPAEATFTCAALTGVLGRVQKFVSASAIRAGGSGLLWAIAATSGGLVPLKRYLCVLKINPKSAPVNMGVDIVLTPFNASTPLTPIPAATRWRVTDDEMHTVAFVADIPAAATLTQLLIRTYPDVPAAVSECAVSVAEVQFFEVNP